MITTEQLQRRKSGIFASDVARIMTGDSVRITLEKMGEIEPPDLDSKPNIKLGKLLEPAVLTAYEQATGRALARSPDTLLHPQLPWLGCHLDAYVLPAPIARVVEAKTHSAFDEKAWGEPGTDEVPDAKIWQVQAQMAVSGGEVADIPVCFISFSSLLQYLTQGTVPIELYSVPRDEGLIEALIEETHKVWRCVQTRTLPQPLKVGDAELLYRRNDDTCLLATPEIAATHEELMSLRAAIAPLEEREAELARVIKEFMGAAGQVLRAGGHTIATWKNDCDSETFDTKRFAKEHPELYQQYLKPKLGARKFLPKQLRSMS